MIDKQAFCDALDQLQAASASLAAALEENADPAAQAVLNDIPDAAGIAADWLQPAGQAATMAIDALAKMHSALGLES